MNSTYFVFTDGECPPHGAGVYMPAWARYGFGDVLYSRAINQWFIHNGRRWALTLYHADDPHFQPTKEQQLWVMMLTA